MLSQPRPTRRTAWLECLEANPDPSPIRRALACPSSTCVDISEDGESGCQSRAVGPVQRCGLRGAQRCSSKVYHVYRWNGVDLTLMSDPLADQDVPLVMNNHGEIAGLRPFVIGNGGDVIG